jgi:hypothetical protein
MLADPIREPESIELPDEVEEVFAALTDSGAKEFSGQLVAALRETVTRGDFRPVQDVIDSWYRSLLFHRQTSLVEEQEIQEDVDRILASEEPGMSLEELRKDLKLVT